MEIAAKTTSMFMLFLLIFVAGGILLQIFLSRREGKWPGLILPLLAFHIFLLVCAFRWFEGFLPHILGGTVIFMTAMVVYLLNSPMDPTAKITWLIVITLLPVFGALLFHEQIRLNQLVGCALAVTGVILFVQPEKDEKEEQA